MRRPILAAAALATAFTACWGSLERSDRTDARDRAPERPSLNAQAQARNSGVLGVAARERAPSDLPPIRSADVTPAMIIRTGQASIEVDSLEPAVALVRKLAGELGGYVANTALQTGHGQLRSATIEVKVPANRFDEGLGGLAPIGKLESVNVSAEDVGEEFTDATARMANARRLETRLIELIAPRTGCAGLTIESPPCGGFSGGGLRRRWPRSGGGRARKTRPARARRRSSPPPPVWRPPS